MENLEKRLEEAQNELLVLRTNNQDLSKKASGLRDTLSRTRTGETRATRIS